MTGQSEISVLAMLNAVPSLGAGDEWNDALEGYVAATEEHDKQQAKFERAQARLEAAEAELRAAYERVAKEAEHA